MATAEDTYGRIVSRSFRASSTDGVLRDRLPERDPTAVDGDPLRRLSQFLADVYIVNSGGNMEELPEGQKEKHLRTSKQGAR